MTSSRIIFVLHQLVRGADPGHSDPKRSVDGFRYAPDAPAGEVDRLEASTGGFRITGRGLFIRFDDSAVVESEEVRTGVVLDFDAKGCVVGMEIPRVKESLPEAGLRKVQLEVA